MKKTFISIVLLLCSATAFCQAKTPIKKSNEPQPVQQELRSFKGPIGFYNLEIGMTKEAVEQLKSEDGLTLASLLRPKTLRTGEIIPDKFEAQISTPLTASPLLFEMTFKVGKLDSFRINFTKNDGLFDQFNAIVKRKYGPAEVNDSRIKTDCQLRNGQFVKLYNGAIDNFWIEKTKELGTVKTSFIQLEFNDCPSGGMRMYSMTITSFNEDSNAKPKKDPF